MYESLYPTDDMWDKFEFSSEYPPISVPTYDEEYEEEAVDLTNYLLRHDCMLSGTCRNEAHREDCCNVETETVVAVSLSVRPIKSGRSVLRTSRLRLRSVSPRPETPSESEEEEEYIASEIEIEGVCDEDFDEFDDEVTDQDTDRINSEVTYDESYSSSSAYSSPDHAAYSSPNHAAYSSPGHAAYSSPDHAAAFHSDHCYHLNKTAVVLDNLGVQTPSDSEEEIDVVSVADREKLTTLPTNPSAKDKQQLQRTVATAIQQRAIQQRVNQQMVNQQRVSQQRVSQQRVNQQRATQQRRARSRKRVVVTTPPSDVDHRPATPQRRRRVRVEPAAAAAGGESLDKRNQHNNMERLRRIDLREAIASLRKIVPAVAKNDRAPKVLVLKEATKYIDYLDSTENHLASLANKLAAEQERLSFKLKELRRHRAKERGTVMEGATPPPQQPSTKKRRCGSSDHRRRKHNKAIDEEWAKGPSRKKQRCA